MAGRKQRQRQYAEKYKIFSAEVKLPHLAHLNDEEKEMWVQYTARTHPGWRKPTERILPSADCIWTHVWQVAVLLLLLLLCVQNGRGQQPHDPIIIRLQDQSATKATRQSGLIQLNCSTGMSCTWGSNTFNMTAGGAGGGASVISIGALPGTCTDGTTFLFSDSFYQVVCNPANTFNYFYGTHPVVPPPSAGWTLVNDGGVATLVGTYGGQILSVPASGTAGLAIAVRSVPGSTWTVTAIILPLWSGESPKAAGMLVRESSTGKLIALGGNNQTSSGDHELRVNKYTNPTTFSAAYLQQDWNNYVLRPIWFLRIQDNGTNLIFSISNNGYSWSQVYSVGRTDFMAGGPDQVGFFVSHSANFAEYITLASWVGTTP